MDIWLASYEYAQRQTQEFRESGNLSAALGVIEDVYYALYLKCAHWAKKCNLRRPASLGSHVWVWSEIKELEGLIPGSTTTFKDFAVEGEEWHQLRVLARYNPKEYPGDTWTDAVDMLDSVKGKLALVSKFPGW